MAELSENLKALHEVLAKELLDILKHGVPCKWDDEGKVLVTRKASAAEMNAAVSLLKHNSITADIGDSSEMRELQAALQARRKNRPKPNLSSLLDEVPGGIQ